MEKQWFYARGDKTEGPVSKSELLQMFSRGEIFKDILVWTDGMAHWQSMVDVEDLSADWQKSEQNGQDLPSISTDQASVKQKINFPVVIVAAIFIIALIAYIVNASINSRKDREAIEFTKNIMTGIIHGKLEPVDMIDWDRFTIFGRHNAEIIKNTESSMKEPYRSRIRNSGSYPKKVIVIGLFNQHFLRKNKIKSFSNWRIDNRKSDEATILADVPELNRTFKFVVVNKDGAFKLSSIE